MKTVPRLIVSVCLILARPFAAQAQTNALVPLPAAAQDAVSKGIIAAKVPDYLLAIRFFEEARKIAPEAPVIYLNLGLAESRIAGRELRAMAWFGAYLAAYPEAPNAAAVKEQIAILDVKNQSTVSRLIQALEDAANKIPEDQRYAPDVWYDSRWRNWKDIGALQLANGDLAAALKIAEGMPSGFLKGSLQHLIGAAQRDAGDLKGARRTYTAAMENFRSLEYSVRSGNRTAGIATGHAKSGDIGGALKSANRLHDDALKSQAQFNIALVQAGAGDVAGYRKTFAIADETADRIQNADLRTEIKLLFAEEKKKIDTGAGGNTNGQSTTTIPPPIRAGDWILKNEKLLNDEIFLNLAATLNAITNGTYIVFDMTTSITRTVTSSDDATGTIDELHNVTSKILDARQDITQMLIQQGVLSVGQARSPRR